MVTVTVAPIGPVPVSGRPFVRPPTPGFAMVTVDGVRPTSIATSTATAPTAARTLVTDGSRVTRATHEPSEAAVVVSSSVSPAVSTTRLPGIAQPRTVVLLPTTLLARGCEMDNVVGESTTEMDRVTAVELPARSVRSMVRVHEPEFRASSVDHELFAATETVRATTSSPRTADTVKFVLSVSSVIEVPETPMMPDGTVSPANGMSTERSGARESTTTFSAIVEEFPEGSESVSTTV